MVLEILYVPVDHMVFYNGTKKVYEVETDFIEEKVSDRQVPH